MPNSATFEGSFTNESLKGDIVTSLGSRFSTTITRRADALDPQRMSQIGGQQIAWEDFKDRIGETLKGSTIQDFVFRGQAKPWRLRTSFHRRRRYDLVRFVDEDIPSLYHYLGVKTHTRFHINDSAENGAFLSLAMHHGYPTPFLDWTYSPYIAAFFAFQNVPKHSEEPGFVRIFVFNRQTWLGDWKTVWNFGYVSPQVSVIDLLAIENDRAIPQQAVTMSTNVDDIESYVMYRGREKNHEYFASWDISYSERNVAMTDLSHMGITAATMFPGISGICEELRERNFLY